MFDWQYFTVKVAMLWSAAVWIAPVTNKFVDMYGLVQFFEKQQKQQILNSSTWKRNIDWQGGHGDK